MPTMTYYAMHHSAELTAFDIYAIICLVSIIVTTIIVIIVGFHDEIKRLWDKIKKRLYKTEQK